MIIMEKIVKLLHDIESEVKEQHGKNYDVHGFDSDVNNDFFSRYQAKERYVEAVELYEKILDNKGSIIVHPPLSDKTHLFFKVLHFVYPELNTALLKALPFAGEIQSNYDDVVSLIEYDNDNNNSEDEEDCVYFYRFTMKQ